MRSKYFHMKEILAAGTVALQWFQLWSKYSPDASKDHCANNEENIFTLSANHENGNGNQLPVYKCLKWVFPSVHVILQIRTIIKSCP
jgi:hypothetical protein